MGVCHTYGTPQKRVGRKDRFVVMILGFLLNVFSIIVLGDYNPVAFPDGSLQEDSAVYDFAYHIAHLIGTIG